MKKHLVRLLTLSLCFIFMLSLVSFSAYAETTSSDLPTIDPVAFFVPDKLKSEIERLRGDKTSDQCAFISSKAYLHNENNWTITSRDNLSLLATYWNQTYQNIYSIIASVQSEYLDNGTTVWFIRMQLLDTVYEGRATVQWCMNNGDPIAPKILVATEDPDITESGQWIPLATAISMTSYRFLSREDLYNLATDLGKNVMSTKGMYMITDARGQNIYADSSGLPYAAWTDNNTTATGLTRPDTQVKDENGDPATDEEGNIIQENNTDNSTNIDMSGMTITLPDGKILAADQIIYDESQKTYYIDSHDTYNTTINYYYSWTYYINYTSITYIGQTEEYSKYYEVYYELPDGRDSADLTAQEVEQLNLTIDVIPYGRSADDTSLRSLYHFDGDTKDSSYWNYCTDFTWNKGASLTYMDAGVFEGALYLDETEHDFTFTLPSNITSGDFTLQFRYYQSYTAAPQTDSYISLSGTPVFYFTGSQFLNSSKSSLASTPIGSWNEIALIRNNGTLYYYLNGVRIGSVSNSTAYGTDIVFHFGSSQQTYKYFDELRFLNYALASGGASYEPTSVPYDTNLSLVLPDSMVPVADEYWKITSSGENLFGFSLADFTSGVMPSWYNANSNNAFPNFSSRDVYVSSGSARGTMTAYDGYLHLTNSSGSLGGNSTSGCYAPFQTRLATFSSLLLKKGSYVFSVVLSDGTVCSLPFTHTGSDTNLAFDWGYLSYENVYVDGDDLYYLCIIPNSSVDIVYMELVSGSSTDLSAEFITSVTGIDKADLNTPTLAVRTDLEITSHQIGGVRPSLPKKGQVWAMVESGYITSIQIYTGSAWEACDGRIWTGARWIPASSYNVITLQDMYDIADATPNYEYIYSESGFWSWWQKSWNAFTDRLFGVLGSGASSGGSSSIAPGSVKDALSQALSSLITSIFGLITEVLKTLIGAAADLISGIFSFLSDAVLGGLKDFFGIFTDGSLLEGFQQTGDDGSTTIGLPDGVSTVFAFFSGFFLLLPVELRSVLFFGMGLLFLLAVFKIVRE